MTARRTLVAVAALQLTAGVAGQLVALRDRRTFDIAVLRWRGRPERVARDSLVYGTGLSAPSWMLAAQLVAVIRLARGASPLAQRTLGLLGSAMVGGYLVEREFRQALRQEGRDRVVTPIAIGGFGLALPQAA